MKTLSVIILSLFVGLFLATDTNAQKEIKFAKGKSYKTMKVTVPANSSKIFYLYANRKQVINVDLSGDIFRPNSTKMNQLYAISVHLMDGTDADNWQDEAGFLSIFTGRKGKYTLEVYNGEKKPHTFTMKIKITNDADDYRGGMDSK